eukprot:TRINITY_DN530_c1_g1_i1.p1 TRINITY_DN530_c1_g1~~TRINITY_DN530_c1_g1_i1.p1  ORF type:complete len:245 (-),score=38.15 TRINITY_DN530_c1_g1_i1:133-867(-)
MAKVFMSNEECCQAWLSVTLESKFKVDSKIVELRGKNMYNIHPSISAMTNLTKLDLQMNKIEEIPEEVGMLTNLKILILSDNKIKNEGIPESLGNLTKLDILSLSNQLTYIPECICDFIFLDELNLSRNDFSEAEFPDELTNLKYLKYLNLDKCKLESFPLPICFLTTLTVLHMEDNNISSIPEEISRLTKLLKLNLGYNPISIFSPLKPLTQLSYLYVKRSSYHTTYDKPYYNGDLLPFLEHS